MCTGEDAPVGQVVAGLSVLTSADVVGQSDAQVRAELLALVHARNQVDAAIADRVATFDARQLAHQDGQYNAAMWLVNFAQVSKGFAQVAVARGRFMRQLPCLAEGMRAGTVSAEHFAKVTDLARHLGGVDKVAPYDGVLAALAATAGPVDVAKACQRIAALENPDGAEPDPEADYANRELILAHVGTMTYLRGRLDPESAAVLTTAIDALMRPPAPGDLRSTAQRRADALTDLATLAVGNGTLPSVGGERPHVGLLITPELLFGTPDSGDPDRAHASPQAPPDPLAARGVPPLPEKPWLGR